MSAYLLQWALGLGAPPEVAAALVERSHGPLPPARDALLRAAVALQAESMERPELEVAARWALAMACMLTPAPQGRLT